MTTEAPRRGTRFWVAFTVGWAIIAYGVSLALTTPSGLASAAEIAAWVAGGHLLHDTLIAPAATLVGVGVAAAVTPWMRGPMRAGLLTTACVLAVAYPALRGFGIKPRNPSLLPLDYGRAVLTVLGVVWLGVAVVAATAFTRRAWRRRPRTRAPRPRRG